VVHPLLNFPGTTEMHPAIDQLSKLPIGEQLEIVQDLWDNIASTRESMPIQEWHREIVQSRLAGSVNDESGLTREEVWNQVDQKRDS
ncbi:MAG: addiction module protein, partial [Pirellulales bacterium]